MRLLIIGKLHGHIGTASKIAMKGGALVTHVDNVEGALKTLRAGKGADLIMIDVSLKISDLTKSLENERFSLPVVACGIGTDSAPAVKAIKEGAKEYLPLPPDAELIAAILETVCREDQTLVQRDPAMQKILKLADQIAPSNASVLITGESGTGKEVIARYIHGKSRRKTKPFISVNCAAIPENLLESELFGHEKGAFTGAVDRRIGKFEEANGGTLLLDEISEMDPALQAKLLRALQEREIDRVGGSKPIKVDIRVLATSNRNLQDAVRKKEFREDLYFRLNVVSVKLPPLRERPLDIDLLADHFVQKYSEANGIPPKPIGKEARDLLHQHTWRGNIRELENTMHRAILLSSGPEITVEAIHLSGEMQEDPGPVKTESEPVKDVFVGRTVADVEKDLILGTLGHCLGNRTQAANILGISIRTLRNKLQQYNGEGVKAPKAGDPGEGYQSQMG